MAQSENVRAFKNELRNYNYYLNRVVTLKNSIEWCYYRLGGVHGIDPSKEPTHSQPNKELEYKLRDDIEQYRRKLKHTEDRIEEMNEILNSIENELRWAIKCVYVEHKPMRNVAMKLFMSHSSLQKKMDSAIRRALE